MVGHTTVILAVWLVNQNGHGVGRSKGLLVVYWSRIIGRVLVELLLVTTYDHNPGFDSHTVGRTLLQSVYDQLMCGEARLVIWLVSFSLTFSG